MARSVHVACGDKSVIRMFENAGWEILPPLDADLVCFTGGEDVSPEMYGEENTHSSCNPKRDLRERLLYETLEPLPMVGICRGAQFLNVMNGGKLIQHIDGHSMGYREIRVRTTSSVGITYIHEDHHQGIIPSTSSAYEEIGWDVRDGNVEILWYPENRRLCFQPHPEWGHEPTRELFFSLIKEYIFCAD